VFPARYELNSYIVFRKRLVSKRLTAIRKSSQISVCLVLNPILLHYVDLTFSIAFSVSMQFLWIFTRFNTNIYAAYFDVIDRNCVFKLVSQGNCYCCGFLVCGCLRCV
jgi:hypothetical protein